MVRIFVSVTKVFRDLLLFLGALLNFFERVQNFVSATKIFGSLLNF